LPPGSFNGSSADVIVDVHAYADDQLVSPSAHGVYRQYGGSTPQEVYASARAALLDLSHAGTPFDGFADYPNVGAGMVTDGESQFTLAGPSRRSSSPLLVAAGSGGQRSSFQMAAVEDMRPAQCQACLESSHQWVLFTATD
jgi:hypothetical protein